MIDKTIEGILEPCQRLRGKRAVGHLCGWISNSLLIEPINCVDSLSGVVTSLNQVVELGRLRSVLIIFRASKCFDVAELGIVLFKGPLSHSS